MERYRKKEMLQTVETLLRANDAIVKTARSNPQGTAEALMQCQESAITLGTAIETFGDKYTNLVQILEDYCENLYQMSEGLSDETLCHKVGKKIQKQLTTLQNGIKYDMPEDRKEIVFLPYKASMWDSLESVWRAAEKDPDCDAYVIPIPYYVKAPDGSLNEEVYEGDQFPKDVPITRYDEYDLEARRPDAIYIHNPYDECNHVTSVHPYFYAKNLKNFTEKLVYIPYFILKEIKPSDQSAINGMKHFCFLPGTLYADQVILQSEDMRQIYINEYIKAAKNMDLSGEHIDRRFLEKKFLGTGSPKVEKLLNTKKEELEIPEAWRRIIEKPDGSWKKIIFYNISVSALLHDEEKLLLKMESVFEIFKENRDEVVLLWRPHPLIQSTIESMRPKLWEAYAQLRDRYIEEGWGIYDDSADIDRAVVLSDAYYGVGSSSVVQLYQKTGKPILMQEVEVPDKYQFIPQYHFSQKIGRYLWFLSENYKGIFSMDIQTGKITLETGMVPDGECSEYTCLWGPMQRCGRYYVCPPINAKYILVLNIDEKKQIPIDNMEISDYLKGNVKYSAQIVEDDYVYLMPACAKGILKVDIQRKRGFLFMDVSQKYKEYFGEEYYYLSTGAVHKYKEEIYMALYEKPYLMKINFRRKELQFIKVLDTSCGFQTLAGNGELIYIISHDGRILQWNIERQKIENEQKSTEDSNVIEQFIKSFCYNDYTCFVATNQNICMRIKKDDFTVSCARFEKVWNIQETLDESMHFTCFDQNENIYLVSEKKLIVINLVTKKLECKDIKYSVAEIEKYLKEESRKYIISCESEYFRGLKGFLGDII